MLPVREDDGGVIFKVYVQPRSKKNEIKGLHGDALKIKITAPPVDGAANAMCISYLAKCLKTSKSSVDIVSGHTGRNKQVRVRYAALPDAGKAAERLKAALQSLLKS
jgi:uncharacterized protein (TIGR00251 family)